MSDDEVRIDAKFREPWDEGSEERINKAKDAVLKALASVGPIRRHRATLLLDDNAHSIECVYASAVPLRGTLTFTDEPPPDAIGQGGTADLDGREVTIRLRSGSYATNTFDFEELIGA